MIGDRTNQQALRRRHGSAPEWARQVAERAARSSHGFASSPQAEETLAADAPGVPVVRHGAVANVIEAVRRHFPPPAELQMPDAVVELEWFARAASACA